MLVKSLEIINTPHIVPGFGVGDRFQTDGKNILLTGENSIGKTTFLKMLAASIQRHNTHISSGSSFDGEDPYLAFARLYDGERYKFDPVHEDPEPESLDDEANMRFNEVLDSYFGNGLVHIFSEKMPSISRGAMDTFIEKYARGLIDRQDSTDIPQYLNESDVISWFQDAIEAYAKVRKIPVGSVRGGIAMMMRGVFSHFDFDINVWGYMVPKIHQRFQGKVIGLLASVEPQKHDSHLSLGERSKQFIDTSIQSNGQVIIVDEPTNGVDRKAKAEYVQKIIDGKPHSQTFASTHDEALIDAAEANDRWKVIELIKK